MFYSQFSNLNKEDNNMFPKQDYFKDSKDYTVFLRYPAQGRHLINCSNYVVMSVLITEGSSLSSPEGQEMHSDSRDLRLCTVLEGYSSLHGTLIGAGSSFWGRKAGSSGQTTGLR